MGEFIRVSVMGLADACTGAQFIPPGKKRPMKKNRSHTGTMRGSASVSATHLVQTPWGTLLLLRQWFIEW